MTVPLSDTAGPALPVAVVVVTFNSVDVIGGCLDSLSAALAGVERSTVIVVDNQSTDGTCGLVERHRLPVQLVRLGRNGGYAAGINAGVAVAGDAEALLVLNPDARLAAGAVATLLATLAQPDTGIAVPTIFQPNGAIHHSLRREPTVRRMVGEALLGGERAARFEACSEIVDSDEQYCEPAVVDWASGAVMLIARACHDALAGWDESFFLYSEETDFCLRARDHGWLVRYTPDASAVHIGGHGERTPLRALMAANRVELFRRRNGPVRTAAFRSALALHELLRVLRGSPYRAAAHAVITGRRPLPAGTGPREAQDQATSSR